jgi:CTP-dependent riboflavin kinase
MSIYSISKETYIKTMKNKCGFLDFCGVQSIVLIVEQTQSQQKIDKIMGIHVIMNARIHNVA